MRADKKKSLAKVWEVILANPLLTEREVAEQANVWNWTAHRAIKELEQSGAKDDRILAITETDLRIVKLWQAEIERRLQDQEHLKAMRTSELSQVIRENTARYTLFRWNATNEEWWLSSIIQINII